MFSSASERAVSTSTKASLLPAVGRNISVKSFQRKFYACTICRAPGLRRLKVVSGVDNSKHRDIINFVNNHSLKYCTYVKAYFLIFKKCKLTLYFKRYICIYNIL